MKYKTSTPTGYHNFWVDVKMTFSNSFLTILVIAASFSVPLLGLTLLINSNNWLGVQTAHKQITVFLHTNNASERTETLERINSMIATYGSVIKNNPVLISRDDAIEELKEYRGEKDIKASLELLGYNPLHDLIILNPTVQSSLQQILSFKSLLLEDEMVYEVDINEEWVSHVQELITLGERLVWFLSAVFIVAIWLILNHALSQHIQIKRDEVAINLLLGATLTQLYQPFIIWGTSLGFIGTLCAVGISWGSIEVINNLLVTATAGDVQILHLNAAYLYCFSFAILIGFFSSVLAVNRCKKQCEGR